MAESILNRYINPDVLNLIADRQIEPQHLVAGALAGGHKSPLSGFAVEFAGHREYVAGDDPRHIDWRLYFTRDKYFIKQYEMETNFVCHLIVDVSASMRYGDDAEQKLLYAQQMAVMLGFSIVKQNDKVSLATFDDEVRGFVRPANSMAQIVRMTSHLDEIDPVEKTEMAATLTELAGRMGRREIVMIFSDFLTDLDALEEALQRMRYSNHEVVLFQVMHNAELTFDFDGMIKFIGMEAGGEFLTQTEDIKRGYLEALERHQSKMNDLCQRNAIECVTVNTSRHMAEVLADYLNRRAEMKRFR